MIEIVGITLFWASLLALIFFGRWMLTPVMRLLDLVTLLCRPITPVAAWVFGGLVVAAGPAYLAAWVWG